MRTSAIVKAMTCIAALQLGAGAVNAQEETSSWQIRIRAIDVAPEESSTTSIGGEARVDSSIVPELDITYFWTENWATELILATSKHDVRAVGTTLGDVDLGSKWVLPPTLTLQYHFSPDASFRPYVGAGLNYTFFYSGDSGALDSVKYDNGFGFALQAGADIEIDDNWAFNLDVKKLWLNTDVEINGGAVTADVDLDPWVFGAGFAYRF